MGSQNFSLKLDNLLDLIQNGHFEQAERLVLNCNDPKEKDQLHRVLSMSKETHTLSLGLEHAENRTTNAIEMITRLAARDFSYTINSDGSGDIYDALSIGLNMLGEELENSTVSKEYFESIINSIEEPLIVTDNNGLIIRSNNSFSQLYQGLKKPKNINNITNSELNNLEIGNQSLPVLTSRSLVHNSGKNNIIYIFRDVTEQKISQEILEHKNQQLKKTNEALDSFVYRVSHDLKSPVVNVLSMIKMLKKIIKSPDPTLNQVITKLESAGNNFQNIINDFLELTRIEKGIGREKSWINVKSAIIETTKNTDRIYKKKEVNYLIDCPDDLQIFYSPIYFKSIIFNLFSNAIKYSKPHKTPTVRIISASENGIFELKVIDEGIGIDLNANKDKLFKMFSRLHNKKEIEGTGVGLYSIKKMIEGTGGKIEVKSELNLGSEFTVSLPSN